MKTIKWNDVKSHQVKCLHSISTTYTLLLDTSPWYRINHRCFCQKNNTCINSWYVAGLDLMSWSTKREKLHSIVKLTAISTKGECVWGKNLSWRTIDCIKSMYEIGLFIGTVKVILNYMVTNIKRHLRYIYRNTKWERIYMY